MSRTRWGAKAAVFGRTPTRKFGRRGMKDETRDVVLLNRRSGESETTVSWEQIAYRGHLNAIVRDLWARKDLRKFTGSFKATAPSHGVLMAIVRP